jgi:PPM family protein phosphatase
MLLVEFASPSAFWHQPHRGSAQEFGLGGWWLAAKKSEHMDKTTQEAQDPKTTQPRLTQLATAEATEVRALVAQNPNTPLEALLALATKFPREVSHNPIFSLLLLETPQLIQKLEQEVVFAFALCEDTAEWLLEMFLSLPLGDVATLISYRKNLSEKLLWRLADQSNTLDKILAHPNCTEAMWAKFASDGATHKLFLARARNLPRSIRELLEKDPEPQIQLALRLRDEGRTQATLPSLRYEGATDVGINRSHNEDAFGAYVGSSLALFVVADGMGGQSTGYVASEASCYFFVERARGADPHAINAQDFLHQTFVGSYEEIGDSARRRSVSNLYIGEHLISIYGLGTTAVALLLQGYTATIAHVGDSRAYLLRRHKLSALTEDHSLLNEYIKAKVLTPEEIEAFPHKNVITRSLGMGRASSTPEVNRIEVLPKDLLLLCSDGLTRMRSDEKILQVLQTESLTLKAKTERLITASNDAGGEDNITVLLVEIK